MSGNAAKKVVTLEDGSRHLVVGVNRRITGKSLRLLPIGAGGSGISVVPESSVRALEEPAPSGQGSLLRVLLANRRAQEEGMGGLSLRCKTEFEPFQYRPLVKFRGEAGRRLLIADETGLGKTIEAGYILVEEYAAGRANRVLLMAPARSIGKWKWEMRSKFGIILHEATIRSLLENINQPGKPFHMICSFDIGSQTKIGGSNRWWESLVAGLDLLIIDEIHNHMGASQKFRRPMAETLSLLSDGMLGLTATPVRKDEGDLFRILELVCPGLTEGVDVGQEMRLLSTTNALTRCLEEGEEEEVARLCSSLESLVSGPQHSDENHPRRFLGEPLPWNQEEVQSSIRFLRGLPKVSAHITRARGRDPEIDKHIPRKVHDTHWIEPQGESAEVIGVLDELLREEFFHIHRQQLASCLPAMEGLMANGSQGLRSFYREKNVLSSCDNRREDTGGEVSRAADRKCFEIQARLMGMGRDDAKFDRLMGILEEMRKDPSVTKAIIFTHFHATYHYLHRRLGASAMFRDGVKLVRAGPQEEDERLQQINDELSSYEGFAVLLTTDRMSEAVDLHAANAVINYDLPYNPQDLQQRIGRIDRPIVQEASVLLVHNLAVRGTVDEAIVRRLVERSRIFESMVGGMEDVASEMAREESLKPDVKLAIGAINERVDRLMLIRDGVMFQLVDRVYDDEIVSEMEGQSPFLGREHEVLIRAFEILNPSGTHSYHQESREVELETGTQLPRQIFEMLGGRNGVGEEMEILLRRAGEVGSLRLSLEGRGATIGPAHEFSKWITRMLCGIEGMSGSIAENGGSEIGGRLSLVGVSGSKVSDSLWVVDPDSISVGDMIESIASCQTDGVFTGSEGDPGDLLEDERISGLLERDRAEHERLLGAKIRRLYAIRGRLSESDADDVEVKLSRMDNEIRDLESELERGAQPAEVRVLHSYISDG